MGVSSGEGVDVSASATMAPPGVPFDPLALTFLRSLTDRALRVPLVAKLLGANVLIAIAAFAVHARLTAGDEAWLLWATLGASFILNAVLVLVALRPIDEVTRVAHAIIKGDIHARAAVLATADRRVAGLAQAFNELQERAALDRAQIRHLARESFRTRESERANLARHLRDSTAQELYGLSLQLTAATEANKDATVAEPLLAARSLAADVTLAVRKLADSVYPGIVGNHGLAPAIEALGSRLEDRTNVRVSVDARACTTPLTQTLQAALYTVAEEALNNVERHSCARSVRIKLECLDRLAELTIEDDGTGFDPLAADKSFSGIGLFRARELLAHAGGELKVISAPGHGTKVIATVQPSLC